MSIGGLDIGGFVGDFAGDFADFATDFATDFTSDFGLDSFTDSFGTEFLTDIGGSFVDFGGDLFSSAGEFFGDIGGSLYEQVGSFAGNADWFNATSFGSILDSAGVGISEFFGDVTGSFSGITNYLPTSISSITGALPSGLTSLPSIGSIVSSATGLNPNLINTALSGQLPSIGSIVTGAAGINPNIVPGIGGGGIQLPNLSSILGTAGVGSTAGYNTRTPGIVPTSGFSIGGTLDSALAFVSGSRSAVAQTVRTGANAVADFSTAQVIDITGVGINTGNTIAQDPTRATSTSGFVETEGGLNVLPDEIPVEREGNELVNLNTGEVYPIEDDGFVVTDGGLRVLPEEVDGDPNALTPDEGGLIEFTDQGEVVRSAADIQGLRDQARQQQTVRDQRQNKAQAGDWRVRLRLAPQSNYLYNDPQCGPVLWPLRNTDGVIFPYTPKIDTAYKADYEPYNLTHSNYRGYFYKGSYVDAININALFTAQDTSEANYLLAVIHFFRSATKMFYGQDAQRGSPPPLVYLSGLGDYQFAEHPCVISQFNYNLPADVDYIRAQSGSSNGTNLQRQRDRQTIAGNPLSYALQRLATVGLTKGALPGPEASPTLGLDNPTYVPTKMDIQLMLFPIQSREQVSKQFSVKNFANGNLLKGGFW